MKVSAVLLLLLTTCAFLPRSTTALNILGIFAYPSFHHWTVHNALITELSKRGHNLTVITNYPTTEATSNYREIHVKPFYDPEIEVHEKLQLSNISDLRHLDPRKIIDVRFDSGLSATRHCLSSATVKEFVSRVRAEKGAFDVMLVEDYYQEALLYLAEIIGCPVIALSPSTAPQLTSHYFLGLAEFNTHAFHDLLDLEAPTVDNSLAVYSNKKYLQYLPQQEALIKEAFELPAETTINFSHLYQRVLFLLSNSYNYFSPPSPILSGKEIKVGGFYIRPPKELSRDIKDFLHDAKYGAIFMTLPSQVYGLQMDMGVISNLMQAFAGMRQKVLFEWDGPKPADIPKNVLIRRWIPISDILAHPYVQLMICTGDIWHVQNSIQRMVPLIGIPITREQDLLLRTVENANIGKMMQLNEVTVERILNTTKEMFANQMLVQQIHYVASFYRSRPLGAMEEAVFWTEFAGKHKTEGRLYRAHVRFTAIKTHFTRLIISILAAVVLLAGGFLAYHLYFNRSGKVVKKAV